MSDFGGQYAHALPVERFIPDEPERFDLAQLLAYFRPAWMDEGACCGTDPEIFFPGAGMHQDREAKAICAECPVVDTCLAYAMDHGLRGVWGNTNERERRRLRPTQPGPDRGPIDHGSTGGYKAHLRRGEKACPECSAANRRRNADQRDARRMAVSA